MQGSAADAVAFKSGRALFERASGPFLETKDAKAFVNTQHLMLYKGWRLVRRPQDLLRPAPPEMIKKRMTKRAATQHSLLLILTSTRSTGKTKIHQQLSSEVDFLGVLVRRSFFCIFCGFREGPTLDPLAPAQSKRSSSFSALPAKECRFNAIFG